MEVRGADFDLLGIGRAVDDGLFFRQGQVRGHNVDRHALQA